MILTNEMAFAILNITMDHLGKRRTPPLCKFCKQPKSDFRELRFHCQLEHPQQFQQVYNWLGETVDFKLRILEEQVKGSLGEILEDTLQKHPSLSGDNE